MRSGNAPCLPPRLLCHLQVPRGHRRDQGPALRGGEGGFGVDWLPGNHTMYIIWVLSPPPEDFVFNLVF